ncbi:PAS domain-containing sensor histidine kinase [Caloramator sp. E03]|uniref:PAS domain-containing sensor histidine kinase n=1 Tax=Caloramator sp. E03 TaxID=2576307 RepID=UPI00143DD976|nr:PAS domain-containing sensor histidine kinase [Caloramator sp. E03]
MGKSEILPQKMKYSKNYVVVKDGIVRKISSNLISLLKYDKKIIVGKDVESFFNLIKLYPKFDNKFSNDKDYYLFNRTFQVKAVTIKKYDLKRDNEYLLAFNEIYKNKLSKKLSFINQFEKYFDNAFGIALFAVPDFLLLKANKNFINFLSNFTIKKENFIGKRIDDIVEVGMPKYFWDKVWERILKTQKQYFIKEYKHLRIDGQIEYCSINITPIKEKDVIKYILVAIKDITDVVIRRKQIENQARIIKEQRDQLEIILKNISDGICIINKDLSYKLLSDSAKEFFSSWEKIKYFGDSLKDTTYYGYDGNEIAFENMPGYRVLKGEKIKDFIQVIKCQDKTIYVNTCGSPVYDKNGEVSMAVLCYKDITEQINYESILKTQMEHFYKIIDSLELPIVRISYPEYKIIEINKKAKELINQTIPRFHNNLDEIKLGQSLKCIPFDFKDREEYKLIDEMEKNKMPIEINDVEILKKNKKIHAKIIFQPILNSSGDIYEILMIIIDITNEVEQKEAIENLLRVQGEIFSFITHEFKTPLSIISAAVQTIEFLSKDELSDRTKDYLKKIKQSCLQQIRLVNNLLDVVRADAGYLKVYKKNIDIVRFSKSIIELVSIYAKQKNINLSFIPQIRNKIIAIDDEKYERILLNLLSNAIKNTPCGKNIYVYISTDENSVCIEVKDEGVGIPKEKQELIFKRFSQIDNSLSRKSDGTGIGLNLTKLFTEALGGRIEFSSIEGVGSSFKVFLPDDFVKEEIEDKCGILEDNRFIQNVNVEFSNIYYD